MPEPQSDPANPYATPAAPGVAEPDDPPAPRTWKSFLRGNFLFIPCTLTVLWFGSQPVTGFYIWGLAVPVLLVWLLYSLVRMVMRPAERLWRLARIVTWVAVIGSTMLIQDHNADVARQRADGVAAQLHAHHTRTGAWPEKLEAVGLNTDTVRREWYLHYRLSEGEPNLFYLSTMIGRDTYEYDFKNRKWVYKPD